MALIGLQDGLVKSWEWLFFWQGNHFSGYLLAFIITGNKETDPDAHYALVMSANY